MNAVMSKHKVNFLLPALAEELGDLLQRGPKRHSSALGAVLHSLCPSHRSLLYQILKSAHQEKLLLLLNHRPIGQIESHCCHCCTTLQDNVTQNMVQLSECKTHDTSLNYPLTDGLCHGHRSTKHHPEDCKSHCTIDHFPLTDCKSQGSPGLSYCCLHRPRMETYTVLCPKKLHCTSCQSLTVAQNSNIVCSFPFSSSKTSSLCTSSSNFCPSSSICCDQINPHSCRCLVTNQDTAESGVGNEDPPCPVLKREQSPSPPPLSPIPSDIDKKSNEKPPSLLHHGQEEELELKVSHATGKVSNNEEDVNTAAEKEQKCGSPCTLAEKNPSGTLLQDVMNRFSEKLETIRPIEKDPSLVSPTAEISEKELPQSHSTNLTKIITTVLHEDSASDYNLSELFNRQVSKEPKSPNTRSRRRQEVLAAMATPTNDSSTRRHSLQIKRELAMFDKSYSRRKAPLAKRAKLKDENVTVTTSSTSLVSDLVIEEAKQKNEITLELESVENHRVRVKPLNHQAVETEREKVKDEIQPVILTKEVKMIKEEEKESEISSKENDILSGTHIPTPELNNMHSKQESKCDRVQRHMTIGTATSEKHCVRSCEEDSTDSSAQINKNHEETPLSLSSDSDNRPTKDKDCHSPTRETEKHYSHRAEEARRSRRNIVPPQRLLSYVTEPRKMFFVACSPKNMFNQRTQKDKALTLSILDASSKEAEAKDIQREPISITPQPSPETSRELAFESKNSEQSGTSKKESTSLSLNQVIPQNVAAKEMRPPNHSLANGTESSDCCVKNLVRLRSSPRLHDLRTVSTTPQDRTNVDINIKNVTCVESPSNSQVLYTSPIKLMFVSPVKDKEGVRYSLKSAGSGSKGQVEEPFDPCVESSWSGTLKKHNSQRTECANSKTISSPQMSATSPASSTSSPLKSVCSPPTLSPPKSGSSPSNSGSSSIKSGSSPSKSASSPPKTVSSPSKSGSSHSKLGSLPPKSVSSPSKSGSSPSKLRSSPPKSASPAKSASSPAKLPYLQAKSVSSTSREPSRLSSSPVKSGPSPKSTSQSPKVSSRRSGESTPTKRTSGTESQRSPGDLLSFRETTPPKRRPGRPKKLGPQLEQKVKRPIGRPRKQKAVDPEKELKKINGKTDKLSDSEDNVNKNLKITVVYGRSRRNKRMVSEGFDQLQTEFQDAWQAVGLKSDLGILMHNSHTSSGSGTKVSTQLSEEFNFLSPVKEPAPQSGTNIKCQKRDDSAPLRKPGRPAKVKISGISVTVTTLSPRQRKIQINKDAQRSPETQIHKRILLPEIKSAKEPSTISCQSTSKSFPTEEATEAKDKSKLPKPSVAVRHSMRERKPSIHFLHAVATSTSRSYSRSNALLRRSKQLLLNKASNEIRQAEQQSSEETSAGKRHRAGQERKNITQDLNRLAGMSMDSIFSSKKPLRWWAASAEEKTLNQELARRIRLISDTWVSDSAETQDKEFPFNSKVDPKGNKKSKHSSVIRTLFDCSPNKPRSCSMQQLCSWFMQSTETQSLAIVKKASSRNPYEVMHFPHSANKKSVCHSPQAERLRKHIKKFAKMVPKSPLQHQQAQRRLRKSRESSPHIRRKLFPPRSAERRLNPGAQRRRWRAFCRYQAILFRAKNRFLSRKGREGLQKREAKKKRKGKTGGHVMVKNKTIQALHKSAKYHLSDCLANSSATNSVDQTQEPVGLPKEQKLCSKAWSPETLKECRVFLRKINSPDNESTEEEWDSCTVTLDDGSPSAYIFARRERELEQHDKSEKRQKGKYKSPLVVSTEPPQPPPAKMLRQSRMRGLSGPRWCDYVFEN
ncbi:uncharacterized protein V6R79_003442 [Siganus canaliculatus]